jgi:hypothetical protein
VPGEGRFRILHLPHRTGLTAAVNDGTLTYIMRCPQGNARSAAVDGGKDPEYFTLLEVAERYRTTEATVRYWRHTGYGPNGVKLGTRVLYPAAEIARFDQELAEQARSGAA